MLAILLFSIIVFLILWEKLFNKTTKRIILILLISIILIPVLSKTITGLSSFANRDILTNLQGEIYYKKRVDGIQTLFKSDANLQNEILIYSHKGKGDNDNILDYSIDIENETISFIAMNDGDWSLFSLEEGEDNPALINIVDELVDSKSYLANTHYIKKSTKNLIVTQESGSLYITENDETKCVKKFYGLYDDKFTGYRPIGFSPDGRYLLYHSMENLTFIGTVLGSFIDDSSYGHNYIMDLDTGKSTRFIDVSNIQWNISEN
jgi:hypothetical protein